MPNWGSLEFSTVYWGNSLRVWVIVLFAALLLFVLLVSLRSVLIRRFKKFVDTTPNRIDDLIFHLLRQTKIWFLLAVSIYLPSFSLQLSPPLSKIIQSGIVALFLVQAWFWGLQIIRDLIRGMIRRDSSLAVSDQAIEGTMPAIEFVGRLILFSLILLVGLDNFGFDVTALVASLGIGGIAVALALQNVLGDLFASLSILFDKPFQVGDFIVVGEMPGTVEKIGLKTTRVRSLSGEQLIFSNADLLGSRIRNFKRMNERRILFSIRVTHQTPKEKLRKIPEIIKDCILQQDSVRFDRAHFKSYGDFSLNFEVVYFVLSADFNVYMNIQQEINLRLFETFAAEGIEFAYPTQTLFLEKTECA